MKVLVFGASGFIGNAVLRALRRAGHTVLTGANSADDRVDLLDVRAIESYIKAHSPDVIINCAGVVDTSADFNNNVRFTENIITAVNNTKITVRNIIITGSAGEYGEVTSLPVAETAELKATSPYAVSKVKEEQVALELSKKYAIPVTVLRVFNPLGVGMKGRFIVPGLIRQIRGYLEGATDRIELTRLDSVRDYVDVEDIAEAFRMITEGKPSHHVYNVGSGASTTNSRVLELLLKNLGVSKKPKIIETSRETEPMIASQADISRIKLEFGWEAHKSLEQTIKESINAR